MTRFGEENVNVPLIF